MEKLEFNVKVVPYKLISQPGVITSGFQDAMMPEVFFNIPVNEDPNYNYSSLVVARGALLSEFVKHVVDDPTIINLGVLPPEGIVVGVNHRKENERIYFLTPMNLDSEANEKPLHERLIINLILVTRDVLNELNPEIQVKMYE